MRPIIFLDIDGVLNTPHTFPAFDTSAVKNFNNLLREINPRIVISSSWRYNIKPSVITHAGFNYLLFTHGLVAIKENTVISNTKLDEEILGRENQINEWITRNGYTGKWIAIDDLPLNLPSENFIRTNKSVGFSILDMKAALALLS
jgi:hypothetical protein